ITTEPSNRSSRTPPRKIRTNNRAPGAAEKAHPISGFLQPDEVIEPAAARVVAMITVATRKHPAAMSPRTPEYSRKAPSNATRAIPPRMAAQPAANDAALQRRLTIDLRRTGRRGHKFWVSRRDRHLVSD